ncbi:DNA repair protein RecO [Ligilactobacillus pabuli]|uniref:DNA repair protein RecO n=1 Tax=Ligilactobacillus pabuli TaxID=2886039 RepID=A0ABQ5JHC7_9LACO|nr:DNA repair protein RecO [Ligilactobacillus pabuli]GKS80470.1 DNA repair protein RecO [Ligilactobacillus pabuli]HIW88677.1 DNA repair protein RecO [Candidatus Ligilactobacillus excrementipullorum]
MATHQAVDFQGIVISRSDYKERDMLVKILTDKFGIKTFFVRGARKRGFKLAAAILPFSHGTYFGTVHDTGLSFISGTRELDQYQRIFTEIELNAYASYILGLATAAFGTDQALPPLWFTKIFTAINLIDEGLDPAIITNIIEIQLLETFGVKPSLESCVICQNTQAPFDFSETYGGILCQRHWHLDPHRLHLDQRTVYYLRLFSVVDLTQLHSIKVKESTKKALRKTLDAIYSDQVGVFVKAKKFLDQMSGWEQLLKKDD